MNKTLLLILKTWIILSLVFSLAPILSQTYRYNFNQNAINNSKSYMRLGYEDEFQIKNGRLILSNHKDQWALLSPLQVFGKNSEMNFRARWVSGKPALLGIHAGWRMRWVDQFYVHYFKFPSIWKKQGVEITKNKWIQVRVIRKSNLFRLYINNKLVHEKRLKYKHKALTAEGKRMLNTGGFALRTYAESGPSTIEIDDLVLKGDKAPYTFLAIHKDFKLLSKSHRYTIVYKNGFEKWARGQLKVSIPYLKSCRNFFGIPAPLKYMAMVQAPYKGYGGYNNWGVVEWQAYNKHAEFLNWHELAHYWAEPYGKHWSIEGMADLSISAINESEKNHFMTSSYMASLHKYKSKNKFIQKWSQGTLDKITNWSTTPIRTKLAYFNYILYRLLGPKKFREMNREALRLKIRMDSKQMLYMASRLTGRDLRSVFNGWVFPGKSVLPINEIVDDPDKDGLSTLDEKLIGTNPVSNDTDKDGFSDLGEIEVGYSPTDASDPKSKKLESQILADGLGLDWAHHPVIATDPTGDVKIKEPLKFEYNNSKQSPADIESIKMVNDKSNQLLYIRIDFTHKFDSTKKMGLTFDLGEKKSAHDFYRINMKLEKKAGYFWHYNYKTKKWTSLKGTGFKLAYGPNGTKGFVETVVPLKRLSLIHVKMIWVTAKVEGASDFIDNKPILIPIAKTFQKKPKRIWLPKNMSPFLNTLPVWENDK